MTFARTYLRWGTRTLGLLVGLSAAGCFKTTFTDPDQGGGDGGMGGSGGGGGQEVCSVELAVPKLALFLAFERSAAMLQVSGGQSESGAQYQAVASFFGDPGRAGVVVSASGWPSKSGDVCVPEAYAADFASPQELPGGDDILGRLNVDTPSGDASSEGALGAAHAAAKAYGEGHPDTISEVIFAVSSVGGTCSDASVEDVATLLEAARDDGIRTWIIAGQLLSSADFATLATAGGGTKLSSQRETALGQLPSKMSACQYVLPQGGTEPRVGSNALREVGGAQDCSDGATDYFRNSGRLQLCPSACTGVGLRDIVVDVPCPTP